MDNRKRKGSTEGSKIVNKVITAVLLGNVNTS